jgi:hypothetical protein
VDCEDDSDDGRTQQRRAVRRAQDRGEPADLEEDDVRERAHDAPGVGRHPGFTITICTSPR